MGNFRKLSLTFNLIFLLILVGIVIYLGFNLLQVVFCPLFEDKNLVKDINTINELEEAITKYYDYLYFGQYEKARNATALLSRQDNDMYDKYHEYICSLGEYTVIIKYAYRLYLETYRCYVITYDKEKKDMSFITAYDKEKMTQIVLSLDRYNDNFNIIDVSFYKI